MRLTCHLGLIVPTGCTIEIRVGGEPRQWQEMRAMCFDDSFEHECVHRGHADAGDRVVLLIRFWHPDLAPQQWASALRHAEDSVREQLSARFPSLTGLGLDDLLVGSDGFDSDDSGSDASSGVD